MFERCIQGILKDKTRIVVSHQLQYLPRADAVVVLSTAGRIVASGPYSVIHRQHPEADALLASCMDMSEEEGGVDSQEDAAGVVAEGDRNGDGAEVVHLRGLGASLAAELEDVRLEDSDSLNGSPVVVGGDGKTGNAGEVKDSKTEGPKPVSPSEGGAEVALVPGKKKGEANKDAETMVEGTVTWRTYVDYFSAAGGIGLLLCIWVLMIAGQVLYLLCGWYLSYWGDMSEDEQDDSGPVVVYTILVVSCLFTSLLRTGVFFLAMITASRRVHDEMLATVIRYVNHQYKRTLVGR